VSYEADVQHRTFSGAQMRIPYGTDDSTPRPGVVAGERSTPSTVVSLNRISRSSGQTLTLHIVPMLTW